MYLLIILLPLFSSLTTGFYGRFLGFYGSSLISSLFMLVNFILSLLIFFEIGFNNYIIFIDLFSWIISNNFLIQWNFLFDKITSVMLVIVTFISFVVHIYSIDYMKFDPHFSRFMSFLSIFTFFMLILITAGNLLQLFLGWEGVGLVSYLLINFWFTRLSASKAGCKALILNRIGDLGLIASIIFLLVFLKTLDFNIIFSLTPLLSTFYLTYFSFSIHYLSIISFLLIIGAIGKSAQLGLHTWLPDAMEGPTPVSALLHAATMVTAGVFLIVRFSPLIEFSTNALNFLIVIGSLTAFFAAFTGIFQHDIKKIIAYSTCSQLGYMIFCCGLSCYNISLFHLFNHAFFKALLFLSAGSVIHAIKSEQDIRRMGSLVSFLPLTYIFMLIGSLTLIGFPFFSGFYSKDFILEIANLHRNTNLNFTFGFFACWLGTISTFFTSFYSFRLIYLIFINNNNSNKNTCSNIFESSNLVLFLLLLLTFISVFAGYLFKEFFIGLGVDTWNNLIFYSPQNNYFVEAEFLNLNLKWVPFLFTFFGFLLTTLLNLITTKFLKFINNYSFLFFINKKWYFDYFYNKFIVYPLLNFSYVFTYKNLDRGFIELIGPVGVILVLKKISKKLIYIQSGQLTHYIFLIVFVLVLLNNFLILFYVPIYLFIIFFILIFYI
uniref:NADH-ubiquinone oxidoreductase chain 5 n=1 Tax=Choreocolax polysiphoniae TaxID=282351 RepID=A0A1J0F7E1_9FLOR|nr:NADH dehydrogenase subunit 5 [Choreocolax polysiphoniae]APC24886.1 NADH dehydrogenase subunit 5 [Choreocolax polysiphoniae]